MRKKLKKNKSRKVTLYIQMSMTVKRRIVIVVEGGNVRRRIVLVVLLLMKLRWMMRLRMKRNGRKVLRKLVLLLMKWMNWVPLRERLKDEEEALIYGSK